MGWIVRQARVQGEAVAAINKAGGNASYASDLHSGPFRKKLSGWKKWIAEYIGIDYFDHVVIVQLKLDGNESAWQQAVDRLGISVRFDRSTCGSCAITMFLHSWPV